MKKFISKSEEESGIYAKIISDKIRNGGILCMFGDLGTGKTVISKYIAKELGIDKFSIKSPTFTFMRTYEINKKKFYHIDLYRLNELDDLLEMELIEIFDDNENIVVIEWAERLGECVPKKAHKLYLEYMDKNTRKIIYEEKSD